MQKIGEISKDTIDIKKAIPFIIVLNIILIGGSLWLCPFDIVEYLVKDNIFEILLLPIVVLGTFIFHEAIHIFGFKLFSEGEACIKVRRDKELGAVIIQQQNDDVSYSKRDTYIVLLAPLFIITVLSIILLDILPYSFVLFTNMVLNGIGSSIDLLVAYNLVRYPSDIKIKYNSDKDVRLQIYEA